MTMANDNAIVSETLEFRAFQDDAWYEIELVNHGDNALTIKYMNFSEEWDEIYHVGRFKSIKEIEDFQNRFRCSSVQLQDRECKKVVMGMTVCATNSCNILEVKFYDAIVVEVQNMQHSFVNGDEECFCIYELLWQHGPSRGTTTYATVASICLIRHRSLVNQALDSFLKITGEILGIGIGIGIALHNQDSGIQKGPVCEGAVSYFEPSTPSFQRKSCMDVDAFFMKLRKRRRFRCAVRTFEGRLNGRCKNIRGTDFDAGL